MSFVLCAWSVRPFDGGRMDWYHFTRMETCVAKKNHVNVKLRSSLSRHHILRKNVSQISYSFIRLCSSSASALQQLTSQLHCMNEGTSI